MKNMQRLPGLVLAVWLGLPIIALAESPGAAPAHDHGAPTVAAPAPAPMDHGSHDHGAAAPAPAPAPMDHGSHDHGAAAPAPAPAPMDHGSHDHGAATAPVAGGPADSGGSLGHGGHGGHGGGEVHHHPGLPMRYVWPSVLAMAGILLWGLFSGLPGQRQPWSVNLSTVPGFGGLVRFLNGSPWPLAGLKMVSVAVFLGVVYAGLFGTALPERNLATTFVWNLWWPLVVVSVFFIGSAWCGLCPWDTIASWLVRRRLWKRVVPHPGLNQKVPLLLRNVWPALLMFMGLTWLELGIGVTAIPMATALMALVMVVLATVSLVLYERKAFCRYFCPVGRALGFYSRLAPIEVRSQDQAVCAGCKTMECYNGSRDIEPCPTHLTVGRFSQNTFCLSCGNCVLSCPYKNVSWRLRTMGSEALSDARPMWDGAWFMLALLGITSFHGVTMMPFWPDWVNTMSGWMGGSGYSILGFTLGMWGGFLLPVVAYAVAIWLTKLVAAPGTEFKRLFVSLPFSTLPLAFVYHLSHNMDHLYRETAGMWEVFANPLGVGVTALTAAERHLRMAGGGLSEEVLFVIQGGLMTLGFWLAVEILRHRGRGLMAGGGHLTGWRLAPMLGFIVAMTGFNLWLMAQEMAMRF